MYLALPFTVKYRTVPFFSTLLLLLYYANLSHKLTITAMSTEAEEYPLLEAAT